MNYKIQEILTKVASDNSLTLEEVKKIYESEFSCLANFIKIGTHDQSETFKNINLIKFGKFYAKKRIIENMVRNKKNKLIRLQREAQEELLKEISSDRTSEEYQS